MDLSQGERELFRDHPSWRSLFLHYLGGTVVALIAGAIAWKAKSTSFGILVAVVVFVVIDFLLIIVPFAFLELRPEATKAFLKNAQDWLLSHARQLMAYTALILGAYLVVSGLVHVS